jgi:hypothetical protein
LENNGIMDGAALYPQSAMMISSPIDALLRQQGIDGPFQMTSIRSGRNSLVVLLSNGTGEWIVKSYYSHSTDKRDRLAVEFGFLQFLNNEGVTGICRALGEDRASRSALYSFLPGSRPKVIRSEHIVQAANFIGEVNRFRGSSVGMQLPEAADACFSIADHIRLAENRISLLLRLAPASQIESEAHFFVKEQLQPLFIELNKRISNQIDPSEWSKQLSAEDRVLSPSDFGFHNTLEYNGSLFFVDFEYAGWDDPAKLICDFFCQPELPVSTSQGVQFMEELLLGLPNPFAMIERVKLLLPVHRLKWCCILLNEFRLEDRERRLHAGVESIGLLDKQLGKAKQYFDHHLAMLT